MRACVAAGSVVLFSSRLWHSSAANTSAHDRRAFYAQYSRAPLGGAAPLSLAVRTAPLWPDAQWPPRLIRLRAAAAAEWATPSEP